MEKAGDVIYSIVYDPKVQDFLQKLPENIRKRIRDKTKEAKKNPFHFFHRLEGRQEFKLRVGVYRVIADIDQSRQLIEVRIISHRRDVYKRQ
jgi:mRNA interferase RelE/StbE